MTRDGIAKRASRAACALALLGCTGNINAGSADEPGVNGSHTVGANGADSAGSGALAKGGAKAGAGGSAAPVTCTLNVGITPLRRLTQTEYNHTVADLLRDTTHPADGFAPDEKLLGFAAGLSVSPLLAEQYMDAAEALSVTATADMPGLLGCDPAKDGEDSCAGRFIDDFGRRVYRRPLDPDQRTGLLSLYTGSKSAYDFRTAIELTLQAMLESPEFLYRIELGKPTKTANLVQLDGYEIASRLSYLLWNSTPTPELLTAAASGQLDSAAGIATQARSMLKDPRAHETVRSFHEQWLELDTLASKSKDQKVYPMYSDALEASMHEETLRFVEDLVFNQDGTVNSLLTSSSSFIDANLAPLYGVTGLTGSDFKLTKLDPTQRMGLLTQASVLAVHAKANQSSPVYRGKFVRERMLCEPLSPPPAGLVIVPPDPDPNASTRDRFAEHSKNPTCASCHSLMDPIGFGFEHYDGIGAYRDMDGKFAVDATGEIKSSRDADGSFDGAIELAQRLAQSQEVRDCVAGQWFVYAFGRSVQNELDVCSRESLYQAFAASGYKIADLIVALTSTDAFRYRRQDMDGGQP